MNAFPPMCYDIEDRKALRNAVLQQFAREAKKPGLLWMNEVKLRICSYYLRLNLNRWGRFELRVWFAVGSRFVEGNQESDHVMGWSAWSSSESFPGCGFEELALQLQQLRKDVPSVRTVIYRALMFWVSKDALTPKASQ